MPALHLSRRHGGAAEQLEVGGHDICQPLGEFHVGFRQDLG